MLISTVPSADWPVVVAAGKPGQWNDHPQTTPTKELKHPTACSSFTIKVDVTPYRRLVVATHHVT